MVGGGPGGLYFAALAARLDPDREITVYDRNPAGRTFGFGVVFSDETLGGIEHADPDIYRSMAAEFARWDDIDVHYRGSVTTSGGHGFAALGRVRLLEILRQRCEKLGVRVLTGQDAPPLSELVANHDLVVAADGVNSGTRQQHAEVFRPSVEQRSCRYIWLGTDKVFDAFTFWIADTPHGTVQVHAYPYDRCSSTLIVEMAEPVWRGHGFDRLAAEAAQLPAGHSDDASIARCTELLTPLLGAHRLRGNNSRWISFHTVRCEQWRHRNVVLLGDAAHTAHFSIGSGTKLAMEDALALAANLTEHSTVDDALAAYETERRPVVASTQRAAQASLEWFEQIGQYTWQPPTRFAVNILTRSRRVTFDNLKLRDPQFAADVEQWYAEHEVARGVTPGPPVVRPPMFQPFRLGGLTLKNRIVVSADGHVLGGRRPTHRLPPGAPGRQGARRCRAGDDRDGVRVGDRADHARLHRPVLRRAGRGVAAHRRLRTPATAPPLSASSSATPVVRAPPG